jgi:hypothetical protein
VIFVVDRLLDDGECSLYNGPWRGNTNIRSRETYQYENLHLYSFLFLLLLSNIFISGHTFSVFIKSSLIYIFIMKYSATTLGALALLATEVAAFPTALFDMMQRAEDSATLENTAAAIAALKEKRFIPPIRDLTWLPFWPSMEQSPMVT